MALINIDMKGVIAELKGIRAAVERMAAVIDSPDDGLTQEQIDELTDKVNASTQDLADSLPAQQ